MKYQEEIDFSQQPYGDWVRFLFERDATMRFEPVLKPFNGVTFGPTVPLEHLARLCGDLPGLVKHYSWTRINRGLWGALMDPFWLAEALGNEQLPMEPRAACVRAMPAIFKEVLAKIPPKVEMENIFYMWWDIIAKNCAGGAMREIVFEALKKVLEIKDERCQISALHGLGHSGHPGAPAVVRQYLNRNRKHFDADGITWIEQCRDGTVM